MSDSFSAEETEVLHRIIRARRDIRHFNPAQPVPDEVVQRILEAAHYAPSVGFMQPWNFIIIRSLETRHKIRVLFEEANGAELAKLKEDERKELYSRLKLEGILDSALNIAVTCDRRRDAPFVLGRAPMPETDLYSTCLAIQNMWLAARAEGVGIGWVSLIDRPSTEKLLNLPEGVQLVAYLCVGYPIEFKPRPMLEELGWKSRLPLNNLVYSEIWGEIYN